MDEKLLNIRTLGELKSAGYQTLPVRMEMRKNLLARLRSKEQILPGIVGYEETVVPEIENGVLAGHHMIFLGERGQAKSRIIRSLTGQFIIWTYEPGDGFLAEFRAEELIHVGTRTVCNNRTGIYDQYC